jgi:hypothetical protein
MHRGRHVHAIAALALIGALVSIGLLTVSGPAAATILPEGPGVLCSGSYETTYNPGLTFEAQDVEVTAHTSYNCLLHPKVASGSAQAGPFTQTDASCVDLLQGVSSGLTTVTWNTGETTTYAWQATAAQIGGNVVVTATGTVVAGKFLGKAVLRQTVAFQSEIQSACGSENGLEQVSGSATLSITGL